MPYDYVTEIFLSYDILWIHSRIVYQQKWGITSLRIAICRMDQFQNIVKILFKTNKKYAVF